jgi:DNA-binding XRE family transcriptional regulator
MYTRVNIFNKKTSIEIDKYSGGDMLDIILKDSTKAGPLIKKIRKDLGVTQEDLAGFAGLSRLGVVKLEQEGHDLKLSTLIKVANLLGFEIVLRKRRFR